MKLFGTPHIIFTQPDYFVVCHTKVDPVSLIQHWSQKQILNLILHGIENHPIGTHVTTQCPKNPDHYHTKFYYETAPNSLVGSAENRSRLA